MSLSFILRDLEFSIITCSKTFLSVVFSILTRVAGQYVYLLSNQITLSKSSHTFKCIFPRLLGFPWNQYQASVSLILISRSLPADLYAFKNQTSLFENGETFMWVAFQHRIIANEHLGEMAWAPLCLSDLVLQLLYMCKVQRVVKVKIKLWRRKEKET